MSNSDLVIGNEGKFRFATKTERWKRLRLSEVIHVRRTRGHCAVPYGCPIRISLSETRENIEAQQSLKFRFPLGNSRVTKAKASS